MAPRRGKQINYVRTYCSQTVSSAETVSADVESLLARLVAHVTRPPSATAAALQAEISGAQMELSMAFYVSRSCQPRALSKQQALLRGGHTPCSAHHPSERSARLTGPGRTTLGTFEA